MSSQPIGLFDSGVGGTSIFKEVIALLPSEPTIYLADSRNAPYGDRSSEEIIDLSIKNTEFLMDMGCKLIIVACNTATTNAIQVLREKYKIPFIGIEPAIKPAALNTRSKAIGILATKGTLSSALFSQTSELYRQNIKIIEQVGEGIVQLIESGKKDSMEMQQLLQLYLQPMLDAQIDYLVLGCTHYPYLIPLLRKMLPPEVAIIDSGQAVARQTKNVLVRHGLLNTSPVTVLHQFYTNGDTGVIRALLGDQFTVEYKEF